jgi:hypothetical protein
MTKKDPAGGSSYRSLCFELLHELKSYVGTSHAVVIKAERVLNPPEATLFKRGEENRSALLTPELVKHLRKMRKDGWSYRELAFEFDVDEKHAWRICNGQAWRWLE